MPLSHFIHFAGIRKKKKSFFVLYHHPYTWLSTLFAATGSGFLVVDILGCFLLGISIFVCVFRSFFENKIKKTFDKRLPWASAKAYPHQNL
jgi:hypothetical protein